MKPLNNYVAIRPDADNDSVGNIKIDTSWNPEQHYSRSGIVEFLPELKFSLDRNASDPMDVDVPMELQVGDRVWFHHSSVIESKKAGFMHKGLVPVRYDLIYLYERGGVKNACAGHIIFKPIEEKVETSLYTPNSAKRFKKDTYEVMLVGCHVDRYRKHILYDDRMQDDHNIEVNPGDIIMMEPHCDIVIQDELHADLFEGERLVYRERRCNILAVLASADSALVK